MTPAGRVLNLPFMPSGHAVSSMLCCACCFGVGVAFLATSHVIIPGVEGKIIIL